MKQYVKSIWISLFFLSVAGVLFAATSQIQTYRKQLPPQLVRGDAFLVNPELLKIISGEFKGVLADYLLLKAAVIDGGEAEKMTEEDWRAVYVLYKQSMVLDPYFYTTAYYTQGNLAWRDGMASNIVDLLLLSADHRYWDWNPHWFLGFDYANFLNDKTRAVEHLLHASKIENAPPILGILAARIQQEKGQTQTSIVMLKAMQTQTDNDELKAELEKRIEAHTGVYLIEQGISAYAARFGKNPDSLENLVSAGFLEKIPYHPYGGIYFYNPQTGTVDYGIKRQ